MAAYVLPAANKATNVAGLVKNLATLANLPSFPPFPVKISVTDPPPNFAAAAVKATADLVRAAAEIFKAIPGTAPAISFNTDPSLLTPQMAKNQDATSAPIFAVVLPSVHALWNASPIAIGILTNIDSPLPIATFSPRRTFQKPSKPEDIFSFI